MAEKVQEVTEENVDLAYLEQRYTGQKAAAAPAVPGIVLEVVKVAEAKRRSVLLPRRCVVERSFPSLERFRWFSRDYERLPTTLAGLHRLAFSCLLLGNLSRIIL